MNNNNNNNNNIGTLGIIIDEKTDTRELNEVPMEEIIKTINEKIIPCLDSITKSGDKTEPITPSIYTNEKVMHMFPEKLENTEINKSTSIYNIDGIDSMIPKKINDTELTDQDLKNVRKLKESILNGDDFY